MTDTAGERGARETVKATAAAGLRSIRWLTRVRLRLVGPEELKGLMLWAVLVGIVGALASVAFREAIRGVQWILTGEHGGLVHAALELPHWQRAITPLLGGVAAGAVLYFGQRWLGRRRSVDYMEAVVVGNGEIAARPTLFRSVSSLLTIASGGSIGREGPMVQLAALLGSKLAILSRAPVPRRRLLVACGAAAGIASAYNAPIAGALFVAEIVFRSIAMESFGPLLVASLTASVTTHHFLGYAPVYAVPPVSFGSILELVAYGLLGIALGHLAPPFLALIERAREWVARMKWSPPLALGVGGLVVGAISTVVPQVWGNGYSVVTDILRGDMLPLALATILIAKVVATAATVGSGAVGGIFTPTLFIGAAVGSLAHAGWIQLFPATATTAGAFALVGMGGFLAATTHAPLTAILMVFEMTLDYDVVLPLMLACVTAHYTARAYRGARSVYHDSLNPASAPVGWATRTVGELARSAAATCRTDATVAEVLGALPKRAVDSVFVVDADGRLEAALDPRRLLADVERRRVEGTAPIAQLAEVVPAFLTPDMSLPTALDVFLKERAHVLPLVSGAWHPVLLGEVSRTDLALALQEQLSGSEDAAR